MDIKNFLINLSVIAAIAGLIAYVVSTNFSQIDFSLATYLCIYFFLFTAFSHWIIIKSVQPNNLSQGASRETNQPPFSSNSKFVSRFLLVTVAKFLFSLLILMGYVFMNPDSAVPFIILFASYYFIFTAFEVFSLMKFFKSNKPAGP